MMKISPNFLTHEVFWEPVIGLTSAEARILDRKPDGEKADSTSRLLQRRTAGPVETRS
jgi:hypothetical protein